MFFLKKPRHPFVLENSTPMVSYESFLIENAWNMANRSEFVKIVIFLWVF